MRLQPPVAAAAGDMAVLLRNEVEKAQVAITSSAAAVATAGCFVLGCGECGMVAALQAAEMDAAAAAASDEAALPAVRRCHCVMSLR